LNGIFDIAQTRIFQQISNRDGMPVLVAPRVISMRVAFNIYLQLFFNIQLTKSLFLPKKYILTIYGACPPPPGNVLTHQLFVRYFEQINKTKL